MKQIRFILILASGCLFWVVFALVLNVSKRGYSIQEFEMWISWIAIVGIASLVVFPGYEIYSVI